jgi:hypothetical protein
MAVKFDSKATRNRQHIIAQPLVATLKKKTMQDRKVNKDDNVLLAKMIRQVFDEYYAPQNGVVYSDPATGNLFELFQLEKSLLWLLK